MISAGQNTPQQPSGGEKPKKNDLGLTPNVASLLCYLLMFVTCAVPVSGIVFLMIEKDNKDVRFHAWQSIALGVAFYVLYIGLHILTWIMAHIATILGVIIGFLIPILILATLILWIVGMVKAYQGERWKIPFLGDFAAKQAKI